MSADEALLGAFDAALPAPTAPDARQSLGSALREVYDAARAAWPTVALGEASFGRYVAMRMPVGGSPVEGLRALNTSDLYLACACALGDPRALEAFDRAYLSQVGGYLAGQRATSSTVDEVKQHLREKLLVRGERDEARIADYTGRGSIAGWLRVAATRAAISMKRGKFNEAESLSDEEGGGERAIPVGVDPELDYLRGRHAGEFAQALRDAMAVLSEQERSAMRFYFVERLTVEQIGGLFQVNKSTVSRWLTRAHTRILERTRELLAERLKLSDSEFHSAMRVMQSGLDVSLRSLLATQKKG